MGDSPDGGSWSKCFSFLERDLDAPDAKMLKLYQEISEGKFRYEMKTEGETPRIAFIINNIPLDDPLLGASAAQDAIKMTEALKHLKFNVINRPNQSAKDMKRHFLDIQKACRSDYDCFAAVIISEGGDGDVLYGGTGEKCDDKTTVRDLIEYLLPDKCPHLNGKPKLFFIQARRGSKADRGKEVYDADGWMPDEEKSAVRIPNWADILIAHSTVPGHHSWVAQSGSWFLQTLASVLLNHGHQKEIIDLLTLVNCQVAKKYTSKTGDAKKDMKDGMKQMSCFSSMLTRQLYFTTTDNPDFVVE